MNCFSLLNKIPTKLRSKYISILKNKKIGHNNLAKELEALAQEIEQKKLPEITYPHLPVAEKVADIKKMIQENQVIVVAGETGSGKSTQLPKICLDLGLGKRGLIGHTQPRRLAARSIAARVATEIGDQSKVSYKIRFSDHTDENTLIKVMTDGVLLAEIKNDKYFSQYEVIIIDEAHERSLNIDFLLGCIKKVLPFRPDLKVIITSATIDHQKFINYFPKAKDIIIGGRTYPVEIRYQNDEAFEDFSLQEKILYAVEELGQGDILVFLPTERDIHETLTYLNKQNLRFTEVLPLFSRLSNKDQNKIFNPDGSTRRIILATNVAETSLTVPGIKYVIDSGLARVSRYSYRTKVQRLPIEKISQASANQRAGRCGRLSAGICIRLYSEDDFLSRKEFTDPEILRTNLASVILQMLFLKLGNIQDFPFIDPPDSRFVKDGFKLLFELQAISEPKFSNSKITADGLKMAIMPLDPKLAKIVIEGHRQNCLKEVISIASFLSVQDPRERPLNFQQKADEAHGVDKDKSSDFIAILNLANRLNLELKELSNKEKKEYFRRNFISPVRFNEWSDIYRQIVEVIHGFKWKLNNAVILKQNIRHSGLDPESFEHRDQSQDSEILKQVQDDNSAVVVKHENLHKAIASGFLSNIGKIHEGAEYLGARGLKFFIFPGSSQFKKKPKWILSSEIVETTKTYARNVASIEPEWLEGLAKHLIKKHYEEPVWSKKHRSVIVNERVTLYGLEIISKRSVQYSRINPQHAREIFIREALVNGDFESKAYFYNKNLELISQIEDLESKSRRKDILVDEPQMYQHYDNIIPENVCDGVSFDKWLKNISKEVQQKFVFDLESLMQRDAKDITQHKYPDVLTIGDMHLPLEYHFNPLDERDGATVTLPLIFLNEVNPVVLEWGVYGFLYDKIVALLRALPKNIRKNCVPVPTYAQAIFESIDFEKDRYKPLKVVIAKHITRIVGFVVDESVWENEELDKYLILNIKIVDEIGKVLAIDKDLDKLKLKFKDFVYKSNKQFDDKVYYDWDFGDIAHQQKIKEYGIDVRVYNCLEEFKDGVRLSYKATQQEANLCMKKALIRLVKLRLQNRLAKSIKSNDLASLSMSMKLKDSNDKVMTKVIDLSFFDIKKQANNVVIPDSDPESFDSDDNTKNSNEILNQVQDDRRGDVFGLPYTKQAFESFYNRGLESFTTNKNKVELLFIEIVKAKDQLDKKLNVKKIPLNFIQLYADIKNELDKLFTDDFLSAPLIYLQRYKYYIQALGNRLEKAKANLQRDRAYQIEVDELENKLAKKISSKPYGVSSEVVIKATFLIKELWISWYLQDVKTIESVSYKKIADFISRL
ncbi:ATP-dependent helicase HrpA [Allofrancisella inopinata]|uniref:ATP-dependent RNA helicase HrpA n=1 Tax=Allofrancisella inopinata TaxID=1085647 RepID=A0AAE6YJ42_9GAMM|nr:ATP-dependent RNA helicase HrpA [Allofrancisella inopinata]QIV95694.1 ATP-dependent RNA helicase HrpA [Allofrancisella inopinata]TDT72151.1 ATP-dependent helicase HrpA [Allofrancisella inopinata]